MHCMLSHSAVKPSLLCSTVTSNLTPKNLRLSVYAVNDADDDRTQRRLGVADNLPGGVAFVDDEHALAHACANAAVDRNQVAARFACEIFLLNDHEFLSVVERMIDRRDDVASDGADDHGAMESMVGTD